MLELKQNHRPLSPAVSAGLFFTSIAWIGLSIALVIVALHAELLRKIAFAPKIIWALGIFMILAGGFGVWLATDELAGSRKKLLLVLTAWPWLLAGSVAVGGWVFKGAHRWPIPELMIGVVLSAIVTVIIAFRSPANQGGRL